MTGGARRGRAGAARVPPGRTAGLPAVFLAVALAPASGCAPAAPSEGSLGPADRRVALARVVVDNRTERTLAVSFRYAFRPGSIEVGRVRPRAVAEMAPVPALEPIILSARGDGFERTLEPRSLEMDALWTWVIADSTTHER